MSKYIRPSNDTPDLFDFEDKPTKENTRKRKAKSRNELLGEVCNPLGVQITEATSVSLSPADQRYLSDRQVGERFNVSRKTIWKWVKQREGFPAPLRVSPGTTRWQDEKDLMLDYYQYRLTPGTERFRLAKELAKKREAAVESFEVIE